MDASRQAHALFPVVVGGIGGSGTRVVAACLQALGVYLGSDLNASLDNLWFTLLFKQKDIISLTDAAFRERVAILQKGMKGDMPFTAAQRAMIYRIAAVGRIQHERAWLQQRADTLLVAEPPRQPAWGWKEPNSHIVLDRLNGALPDMKYIHVARNGLDMAFSDNQNQLSLWGTHLLGTSFEVSPYYSLKYWRRVHERVLTLGASMEERFLLLRFDDLCLDPTRECKRLLDFLGFAATEARLRSLSALVDAPTSGHRYKRYGLHYFNSEDVAFVAQMGFETRL